jgi:hypothetical protein
MNEQINRRQYLLLDRRADDLIEKLEGLEMDAFDTTQLGLLIHVSDSFLKKGRCQGYGPPFVRLGTRCIRYYKEDLITWLKKRSHICTKEYTHPKIKTDRPRLAEK